jgi:hypothetical protein
MKYTVNYQNTQEENVVVMQIKNYKQLEIIWHVTL